MKKIVVPTDFSKSATNATKIAASIAKKTGAELVLVHVYERPIYNLMEPTIDSKEETKIRRYILDQLEGIMQTDDLLALKNVSNLVLADCSVSQMMQNSQLADADLVVIGSHDKSSTLGSYVQGTNTEKLICNSPCACLVLKEHHTELSFENIVFASTFEKAARHSFVPVFELSNIFHSRVHLLHVNTPGRFFQRTEKSMGLMTRLAHRFQLRNYTTNIVNDYSVEEGIQYFTQSIEADVLAIPTGLETKFYHLLNGNLAQDMAHKASRPVLTLKRKTSKKENSLFQPIDSLQQIIGTA